MSGTGVQTDISQLSRQVAILLDEGEGSARTLDALRGTPAELLPTSLRLRALRACAELSLKHAPAAQSLLAAQEYGEQAVLLGSTEDGARARLLTAVALRKLKRFAEAEGLYRETATAIEGLPAQTASSVVRLRLDLALDQAIFAFQKEDFLGSARVNARVASLARAAGDPETEARAWLNTAVSWERVQELTLASEAMTRGRAALTGLASSPLHGSFALTQWKLQIDHGPFPTPLSCDQSWTDSQKRLHQLYAWEYALCTGGQRQIAARAAETKLVFQGLQGKQFAAEIENLATVTSFLTAGKESPKNPTFLSLRKTQSLLEARKTGDTSSAQEGFPMTVAAWLCVLFKKGQWKRLAILASLGRNDLHPVVEAWGARAHAWLAAKSEDWESVESHLAASAQLARIHHLSRLIELLEADRLALEGKAKGLEDFSPLESAVHLQFRRLLPHRHGKAIMVTENGRAANSSSETPDLIFDGLRRRVEIDGREIPLDKKAVLHKLIAALFEAFPKGLTKDELTVRVWDEAYNPLIHDTLIYTAVSRLRKVLTGYRDQVLVGDRLIQWKGSRPFRAVIQEDTTLARQQLNDRQIRILGLFKNRGLITKGEIIRALELAERTVVRDLGDLVDRKILTRQGSGPSTRYCSSQ